MQFSSTILVSVVLATAAHAADQSEVNFLTALVSDVNSNLKQYIDFAATAKTVPSVILSLATKVKTYTDDSYTTLLNDPSLDVPALESFASQLPWYSRLAAEATGAPVSGSASSAAGSSASGSITSSASASASASASSKSSSSAAASSSSVKASSSKAGANLYLAPAGAVLGALAVALL